MSTKSRHISINGLHVEIVRKDIKNLHLGVYPPHGRVRVATPLPVSDQAVRLAVIGKLGWIKRHKARFENQPRQSTREMVNGETHYFLGRRLRLRVIESKGAGQVFLKAPARLELHAQPKTTSIQREHLLNKWYRQQLQTRIVTLVKKWEAIMGVQATEVRIKKMKTKWGSCNITARRIWLNLELAKKPVQCLEYIIVHELSHLIERHHDEKFVALMNKHLPQWRRYREELNAAPLAQESWTY
jgi:predicted metal-dependent hydrolase